MKPAALAIATSLLVSACPGRPAPSYPFDDPERALLSYREMRQPARVLRAEARVDRRGGDEGRVRGTVLMFIERPDHVRFDAMTHFGPAAVLTSDGERFALMDLRESRFFVGPPCPANIERLLGIRLGGAEVTRLLLGETPHIEHVERTLRCCDQGAYEVLLEAADGRRQELVLEVRPKDQRARPEAQRLRLKRSEVFAPDGSTQWRVTYDDYRFVEDQSDDAEPRRGVAMPFVVRFEDPQAQVDTLVRFEQIDLNVEIPPNTFVQQARPGLAVEDVLCD